jgi:hypothetical protein
MMTASSSRVGRPWDSLPSLEASSRACPVHLQSVVCSGVGVCVGGDSSSDGTCIPVEPGNWEVENQ